MEEKYYKHREKMKKKQIPFPQNDFEFINYCKFLDSTFNNIKVNYLEIGSRHGGSLYMASRYLTCGSKIISIELPNSKWGIENSEITLQKVEDELNDGGYDCKVIFGNSLNDKTYKELIEVLGNEKLDIIFFDGDHTFNGIKGDFETYSPLLKKGGYSVFHDIVKKEDLPKVEVWKLWEQFVKSGKTIQFIAEYGIGVYQTDEV